MPSKLYKEYVKLASELLEMRNVLKVNPKLEKELVKKAEKISNKQLKLLEAMDPDEAKSAVYLSLENMND